MTSPSSGNVRRRPTATSRSRFAACCRCLVVLPSVLVSDALLSQPLSRGYGRGRATPPSPTARNALLNGKSSPVGNGKKNGVAWPGRDDSDGGADLFRTLELKDEALVQAQSAVFSLEKALGSAVTNLESMQQQLQLRVVQMEQELETARVEMDATRSDLERAKDELRETRAELVRSRRDNDGLRSALDRGEATEGELGDARSELERAGTDLREVRAELIRSRLETNRLESALARSEEAAGRADELEAYVEGMEDAARPAPPREEPNNPWQLFSGTPAAVSTLSEWIAIKGAKEGEIQISGKVVGHPTIPDGDAIVTSPLVDPGRAVEKKVVTTLSGSKYRLGTPMTMPASNSQSMKIANELKKRITTEPKKKRKLRELIKSRPSMSIPDLTGDTLGNGRYLLAGDATSSINGRSVIQTAYRASPFGKPMGEPLCIKHSSNQEAMKREYANYQKVSSGLKRGSFIRRVEFLPAAGREVPERSALVMHRGAADVKAFMPRVGGRLEGELLLDCAHTALRCVEALHAVRLVWNDLKTENFVVIEDPRTGGVSFRGIDLESCMPVRTPPVDYTPEACPPEFARSFLDGEAGSYSLEYSYDVWSFGMFLYEVSTGRGFFDGYSAEKITKTLPAFRPNFDKVEDPVLADLISQCLSHNPEDRPSVAQISKHPFFASTAKNPFDFLFGYSI